MTLRAEIIAKHEKHHSIWQNKSTLKWCTKLGEEKRLLMRKERSDLENANDYKRFLGKTEFASRPIHDITEQDIVRLTKAIVYDVEKIPHKRYKSIKTILRTIFNHARIHMDIECISVKNVMDNLRFPSTAINPCYPLLNGNGKTAQSPKTKELSRLKGTAGGRT